MKNPFESGPKLEARGESREWRERLSCAFATVAKERKDGRNEDVVLFEPEAGLFGVFDGMGGRASGDKAAQSAARVFQVRSSHLGKEGSLKEVSRWMEESLEAANALVHEEGKDDQRGTTATVLKLARTEKGPFVVIGQVGDSRAYEATDLGDLVALTVDDSLATPEQQRLLANANSKAELLQKKELSFLFQNRASIGQYLGLKRITPSLHHHPAREGVRYLLATDGLTDNLTERQMRDTLDAFEDEKTAMNRLAAQAHKISLAKAFRSKQDDISGVLIRVKV